MAEKHDKHEQTHAGEGIDEELSALLDSTLNEFDATQPNDDNANTSSHMPSTSRSDRDSSDKLSDTQTKNTSIDHNSHASDDNFDRNVNADFAKFDEMFAPLLNSDPDLREHWSKLTQTCSDAANSTSDEEFQKSLQETLKTIADKAKNVVGDESNLSEEELAKVWSNLGVNNEENDANGSTFANLMPIMTNMMQNLLSKELLYPALSELCDKYPSWLSENKDKLSAEELKQYTIQLDLMRQVCEEFDSEKPDDSETVKKERFQRILSHMQRMQACGSPPTELIGDVPDFGASGLPANVKFPEFPGLSDGPIQDKCVIM